MKNRSRELCVCLLGLIGLNSLAQVSNVVGNEIKKALANPQITIAELKNLLQKAQQARDSLKIQQLNQKINELTLHEKNEALEREVLSARDRLAQEREVQTERERQRRTSLLKKESLAKPMSVSTEVGPGKSTEKKVVDADTMKKLQKVVEQISKIQQGIVQIAKVVEEQAKLSGDKFKKLQDENQYKEKALKTAEIKQLDQLMDALRQKKVEVLEIRRQADELRASLKALATVDANDLPAALQKLDKLAEMHHEIQTLLILQQELKQEFDVLTTQATNHSLFQQEPKVL